jgi:hypothetical protein
MNAGLTMAIMRIVLALDTILMTSAFAGEGGAGAPDAHARKAALRHIVVSGRVRSMGVSQLEPGATPQASFYLDPDDADAGSPPILVVIPWPRFPCMDGMRAELEGDFSPTESFFPPILLSPEVLSCDGMKARP